MITGKDDCPECGTRVPGGLSTAIGTVGEDGSKSVQETQRATCPNCDAALIRRPSAKWRLGVPRPTHRRPTKEQMDERVVVPLDPVEFLEGVLKAGPHPEDDQARKGS